MRKLTIKHVNFCKEYIRNGGNRTKAYKSAFDCSKVTDKSVNESSSRLLNDKRIIEQLEELQKPLQKKFEYTIENSFRKLLELQEKSEENGDIRSSLKAEELKGKLFSLYVNRVDVKFDPEKIEEIKIEIIKTNHENTNTIA
jgi:hypothetical protein